MQLFAVLGNQARPLRPSPSFVREAPESLARSPRLSCEKRASLSREVPGFLARSPRLLARSPLVSCEKSSGFLREAPRLSREAPSFLQETPGFSQERESFFAASWSQFAWMKIQRGISKLRDIVIRLLTFWRRGHKFTNYAEATLEPWSPIPERETGGGT